MLLYFQWVDFAEYSLDSWDLFLWWICGWNLSPVAILMCRWQGSCCPYDQKLWHIWSSRTVYFKWQSTKILKNYKDQRKIRDLFYIHWGHLLNRGSYLLWPSEKMREKTCSDLTKKLRHLMQCYQRGTMELHRANPDGFSPHFHGQETFVSKISVLGHAKLSIIIGGACPVPAACYCAWEVCHLRRFKRGH